MSAVRKVEKWEQVINEAVTSALEHTIFEEVISDSDTEYFRKRVRHYRERRREAIDTLLRFGGAGIQVSDEVKLSLRPQVESISASLYRVNNLIEESGNLARRLGSVGEEYSQGVAAR